MGLLEKYAKKRDFRKTPEPKGKVTKETLNRFVIQRHEARKLHYDLRLEIEGVLKSWAIPKGPSMNPSDKRLAIQTEDHPTDYLTFEGTIPEGNYGAGEMKIWDEGTYQVIGETKEKDALKQLSEGNMKIEFFGKKIKGEFALIETKRKDRGKQWLLIKKDDKYATDLDYDPDNFVSAEKKPEPKVKNLQPEKTVQPMLATLSKKIFNDPDWVFEMKWDGYRIIASIHNGKVTIYSRNGINYNSKYPSIVKELEQIDHNVILDGELVFLDQQGKPDFQKLQNFAKGPNGKLHYYVFDMLHLNGHSMLELPLLKRKSLIPEVLEELENISYCQHIEAMGTAFYNRAVEKGMEGIIAKKADSTYTPGGRSDKWLKIKAEKSQEAIICGYIESETGGAVFGSIILGVYEKKKLIYVGNCGTGFSHAERKELLDKMKSLEIKECPLTKEPNLKGRTAHWIEPKLICELNFSEWTKKGILRHPAYKGLREDKTLAEIQKEETKTPPKKADTSKKPKKAELEFEETPVSFTNLDKVYWPEQGYRKYDLIDYYIKMSDYILPYLKDRPQNLHRHPNGTDKQGFYQKDMEGSLPDWIETTKIYSESTEKGIEYLVCQKEETLYYMANLGCIEINPWNSRIQSLENPDYTVIDIDPTEKTSFQEVIEVAQAGKEVLDMADIKGFCKTSGSKGIHIYIPLNAKYSYDEARYFTKLLCYYINEKLPKITSMERSVKKRKGRIYLDYLQNAKGQTLAAPYCVRPKKGATVSAPLKWNEVKKDLDPSAFTIKTMPERIKKVKDPFKDILGKGIDMEAAIKKLEEK